MSDQQIKAWIERLEYSLDIGDDYLALKQVYRVISEMKEATGGCSLCGADDMTADCNNANCIRTGKAL
jgi:hypothetical protein